MGRRKPSDPEKARQARLQRDAKARHADRIRAKDPGQWGISAEIVELPTSADVSASLGHRGRVVAARRSDAFTLLHQAKRYDDAGQLVGGISDLQMKASQRYVKDWMERAGLFSSEPVAKVDELKDGQGRVQTMIDAGARIDAAHALIGRAAARLLQALVEPMAMRGEIRVWRELVRAVTGEAQPHAQAAAVRLALENLRLAYDELDGLAPRADEEPRTVVRLWRAEPADPDPEE